MRRANPNGVQLFPHRGAVLTLSCLAASSDWDFPFFKRLANNDTGAAPGHQGGIVIPKDLRVFFPGLTESNTSAWSPTTDRRITAELFVEGKFLAVVDTRYQYQTWGGERSAESRLTDQLVPLRELARGGDILIFQRSVDALDLFRLTLVRQTSTEYSIVTEVTEGKRWGALGKELPLTQRDLDAAVVLETSREQAPFFLVDEAASFIESRTKRVARSVAFRETVNELYACSCAVCGSGLRSPLGKTEVDAAHIVPRARLGPDDARNGLSLCKRHHWAFDNGLFGISDSMAIIVPTAVMTIPQNIGLKELSGRLIYPPSDCSLTPHCDALEWHRENVMFK